MPSDGPIIRVFPDKDALARGAAARLVEIAAESIAARGRFSLALSGGSTPRALYRLLAGEFAARIDWTRTHLWFGDERCVPQDHAESNARMARETLVVPIPAAQVHPVPAERSPAHAAEDYERALRAFDGASPFDLTLLGMGADGHTASLFPGTTALDDEEQLCCATWVEKLKAYRLTLTLPVFDHAAAVLFLACGADKAPAWDLATANDPAGHTPPAGRVRPSDGELVWYVDRALDQASTRD